MVRVCLCHGAGGDRRPWLASASECEKCATMRNTLFALLPSDCLVSWPAQGGWPSLAGGGAAGAGLRLQEAAVQRATSRLPAALRKLR